MPTFSSADLATWAEGRWTVSPRAAVTGFGTDTRALRAGDVFVAVRTERRDGHDFLGAARSQGAACALVGRPVADDLPQLVVDDPLVALRRVAARWRADFPGCVIGVTGSVGKTSTKELLSALLGTEAFVTEANLNNLIGVPLMLLRIEPGIHRFAVIEAGMSVPGELGVSAAVIRPDLAIVTNVAPVHLEGVGSLAGIAREKATLVAQLAPRRTRDHPGRVARLAGIRRSCGSLRRRSVRRRSRPGRRAGPSRPCFVPDRRPRPSLARA